MIEVQINKNSWLNLNTLLRYKDIVFWDHIDLPQFPDSDGDLIVQLNNNQAKRLDLVAYDYYGDANFLWVILHANELDYPNQAFEGMTIRLPDPQTVEQYIQERI